MIPVSVDMCISTFVRAAYHNQRYINFDMNRGISFPTILHVRPAKT